MTTSTPTYRHSTPPPNNIIDRKRHMKMYPATTAIKHSEEDKDLDDIDVLYEDTDLHINVLSSKDPFGFLELNISEKQIDIKYKKCGSINQAVLTFKKNKLTYTIFYDESECRTPPPRCLTQSPKTQLEIC